MTTCKRFLIAALMLCALARGLPLRAAELAQPPQATNSTDMLQVGDVLRITMDGPPECFGRPPLEEKIKENGTVSLPRLEPLPAAGKTTGELEKDIKTAYVPRWYKQVSVSVTAQNRFYFVGGFVTKPGDYPHLRESTVLKAIDAAGGFTPFARKGKVTVTRSNGKVEKIDCKKALKDPKLDLPVYPGDRIFVPRSIF